MSPTSSIHVVVFLVSFVCVIAGMFVLTPTFWRLAQWRSLAPWLVLFPSGALALLVVQTEGPWVGLMQRLLVGTVPSAATGFGHGGWMAGRLICAVRCSIVRSRARSAPRRCPASRIRSSVRDPHTAFAPVSSAWRR